MIKLRHTLDPGCEVQDLVEANVKAAVQNIVKSEVSLRISYLTPLLAGLRRIHADQAGELGVEVMIADTP